MKTFLLGVTTEEEARENAPSWANFFAEAAGGYWAFEFEWEYENFIFLN